MACNLTASTTGSLYAATTSLLQGDLKLKFHVSHYWIAYQELNASSSGSLNASLNHFLEASATGSLQASTKIKLNAKLCIKWPSSVPPP